MKKKGLIITSIIVVLALVGGVVFSNGKGNKEKVVDIYTVKKGELNSFLSTSGVVKSKQSKEYYGAGLKISKANVQVGNTVKKGDVLLTYDTADLKLQVKQAEIQYNNAVLQKQDTVNQKSNLDNKIAELDKKIKELESSNNPQDKLQVPTLKQQRDAMQAVSPEKLKQLDNSVALAKASLDSVQNKYDQVKDGVIADFDGVITTVSATEGSMSSPTVAMIVLQDLNSVKLTVSLNKFDAEKVKAGQEATIKNNNKTYKGSVAFISPSASKPNGLSMGVAAAGGSTEANLTADIDILENGNELKVDFGADVDILTGTVTDAIKIPIEALVSEKDDKNFVFINENGIAKKKEIKVGLQSDTEIQVLEGLSENDKIILTTSEIQDGMKVVENKKGE